MEASDPQPQQPRFEITGQSEEPAFDQQDPNATQWTVNFTTEHGVRSSVTMPASEYNAENVAKLINAKIATIDQVHNLSTLKPQG